MNCFKPKKIHCQQVSKIQEVLRKSGNSFSLKRASSNTLRNGKYKGACATIDLSDFNALLELNVQQKWAIVEPRVTINELTRFCLRFSLIPQVVPEFTSITIGGAIMGAALESSSHLYGQFNDSCLEYECVLGNGELVIASREHNPDLFFGCSGSYGTLAIVTAVKLRLNSAKKWVHLHYHRFDDPQKAVFMLTQKQEYDFIEGIVYSPKSALVIGATMCDQPSSSLFRQNRPWSPWYVQHLHDTQNLHERMTILDYLFRFDLGAFWMGQYAHSFTTMLRLMLHLGVPKVSTKGCFPSFFFRLLFGWAFTSHRLYKIWHRIPEEILKKLFLVHDFYAPFSHASEALDFFIQKTGIFPIWLCPVKGTFDPQFLSPHFGKENFLNIGLYGIPQTLIPLPILSAELEKKIHSLGGRKMLYSFTYYDAELFSEIYYEERYKDLRNKFSAENAFPTLYNKVTDKGHI